MKKGGISVQTENIFPVIKKWLYSDKDIFLRELVSNACDAITRHKRLVSLAEAEEGTQPYRISVKIDKEAKILTVEDNGIGMSEADVDKYINNMAISGALDFISKYESEDSKGGGIIGHFGLGFYSAFMVADSVEIETKSYTDACSVHWECKEDGEYEMGSSEKTDRGSEIHLRIAENELEYLDYTRIKGILEKYCSYMPYPIYCIEGDKEELVNATTPVWQRPASELSDDDYNTQYKKLFSDFRDPLFYVHINADYPLNFKGVLYFPAQRNNFEPKDGVINLFYNSVFVADNIKEIVPDYLSCLCGALDCPELPLNVSRSYLQDDAYVRKLSAYIIKKVADKLCKLKNDDFEKYCSLWSVIKPYIEYGCIKDAKFYDRVKGALIIEKADGGYADFASLVSDVDEKSGKKIYYTTDVSKQACYVSLFTEKQIPVYVMDTVIDTQFASFIEDKTAGVKFLRVDSSVDDIGEVSDGDEKLKALFEKVTGKDGGKITFASISEAGVAALIKLPEENRRFSDMMRMYAMVGGEDAGVQSEEELVINTENATIKKLFSMPEEHRLTVAKNIYLTAVLTNRQLSKDELVELIDSSNALYELL